MSVSNFPAWERRLDQAPEHQLNNEVQNFLRMLRTVGTPMIDGHAVHIIYYGAGTPSGRYRRLQRLGQDRHNNGPDSATAHRNFLSHNRTGWAGAA